MEILMSMVFLITLFLPDCLNLQPSGEILIISPNHTEIDAFESENALFGRKIPSSSSEQGFLYDVPYNACVKLDIKLPEEDIPFYAVYKRRSCPDDLQAFNLQNASFAGAIFYDERDEDTFIRLKAKDRDRHIHIYVTFVPQRTAKELREKYLFHSKCQAMILSQQKDFFNFKAFIIAAGTLGSLALFGVIAAWSIHLCYNCYKKRKARLPIRRLQQLETKSFAKGDPYEVCAICLEAYEETEVLRILPCRHAYHKTCVDPWLTQNKRICPVCKQAVLREDDPNYPIASSRSSNSERTPLLGAEGGEISSPEISTSLGSRIRTLFSRKRRNSGSSDDLENSRTAITISTSNDTRPNYASINSVEESEARINYGSFYSANDLNDSSSFYQSAREDQLNTSSGNFQTPTSSRFASANQSYDSLTTHTITPGVKEMENVEFWDVTEPDESYVTEDEKKNDTLSIGSFKDCQEASVEFVDNSKSPSEQHESI